MFIEISFFISGLVLGLSGGLTPGPLLTLVISESLRRGRSAGIKIAIAPLITDLPIILSAFFILSRISNISFLIGIIYLSGSIFLSYLGYENICFKGLNTQSKTKNPHSLIRGIITNFLNPSPYLFWFTLGIPIILKALNHNLMSVILFIFSMYLFLVGSKIILVLIICKYRFFLKSKIYLYSIRGLGIVLFLFAVIFLKEGLKQWFDLFPALGLFLSLKQ
jgi:threonine/homoserine/homoserine lactone efflux protein